MKKQLLIHFTDVSVCLNNLKELGVKISPQLRNHIKVLHNVVMIVNQGMPLNIVAEVCFRTANRILKSIEMDHDIRFVRYKKQDYSIS